MGKKTIANIRGRSDYKQYLDIEDKYKLPVNTIYVSKPNIVSNVPKADVIGFRRYLELRGQKDVYDGGILPEIVITGKNRTQKKEGGIHIAPSKRGTFTAAATKHGMGVQEFASRVLRNKDSYSPAMVKKANFAKNASKWNH